MKVKNTLAIFSLTLCVALNGQIDKKSADIIGSPKDKFVKNQDYLAPTTKEYKNVFGDSLKGFDEEALKLDALANNVGGQEYSNFLSLRKRAFINAKYKIGAYQAPTNPTPGKKGNSNTVLGAPCVNEGFESTSVGQITSGSGVSGWTISSGMNSCNAITTEGMPTIIGRAGSPEFWIVQTPITKRAFYWKYS
jgi:hypothetical protein